MSSDYIVLRSEAMGLCIKKHGDKQRRFSTEPYFVHPLTVGAMVKEFGMEYQVVAYLHDILEDTDVTVEELRKTFPEWIVEEVEAITKEENENYDVYLSRVKCHKIARIVKIADMLHNLKDFYQFGKDAQVKKYTNGILVLAEEQ